MTTLSSEKARLSAEKAQLSAEKAQLRDQLRKRRRALNSVAQRDAANQIVKFAAQLPEWENAQHIAIYLPNDGEVDTGPLTDRARSESKMLLLPVIIGNSLEFALWQDSEELTANRYDILEPPAHAPRCEYEAIDIVFLPLVGWDKGGGRLGMGGGFYDRCLAGIKQPLLIGLAHSCQEVTCVPCDKLDVRLDRVVTDSGLVNCK